MAESILDVARRISEEHGALPVTSVHVRIGELQMVVPEALQHAFEASGAELTWEAVPAQVRCTACGYRYVPEALFWVCPECDSVGGEVESGNELVIVSVELADVGEHSDESERGRERS